MFETTNHLWLPKEFSEQNHLPNFPNRIYFVKLGNLDIYHLQNLWLICWACIGWVSVFKGSYVPLNTFPPDMQHGTSTFCRDAMGSDGHIIAMNMSDRKSRHLYPLVNYHNYGKSPFLMGKSTINGHFQ